MLFEFATATRILFGPGALKEIGPAARAAGRRALVVTGKNPGRAEKLRAFLSGSGVDSLCFPVAGEPTIELVESATALAKAEQCDLVIGFGGGSALDAGKATAALAANPGAPLDYLEVVGRAQPLPRAPLPYLAVPTTAGTGTEVTRNAVLGATAQQVKVSLRSPLMLPRLALVDPELTLDLPAHLTATTGLDALTQLIEPYVSCRANPMTDALCEKALPCAARSLRTAFEQGQNLPARQDMAFASLMSGLALANAGLGAVHGLAAPLGGRFSAPHGALCAALLPHVMTINVQALRARAPGHPALRRYEYVAGLFSPNRPATAEAGIDWVRETCALMAIPPLRRYGIQPQDFPVIAEKAQASSSMKGNPIALELEELQQILERAW